MGGSTLCNGSIAGGNSITESLMCPAESRRQNGAPRNRSRMAIRRGASSGPPERSSSAAIESSSMRRSSSVFSESAAEAAEHPAKHHSSSRRASMSAHRGSDRAVRGEQLSEPEEGQALGWIGGGQTWGCAEPGSPVSSASRPRSLSKPPASAHSGGLRHPAPIRTSVHSSRRAQPPVTEYDPELPQAGGEGGMGSARRRADREMLPEGSHMSAQAMYTQIDSETNIGMDLSDMSEPASVPKRANSFSARPQRSGSARHSNSRNAAREMLQQDDSLMAAESPPASAATSRTQHRARGQREPSREAGERGERAERATRPIASYSAMSSVDYTPNSGRGEPPLAPGMRAQIRSIRLRDGETHGGGNSPSRGPATPGSIRSVGTATASQRGEPRTVSDQVCKRELSTLQNSEHCSTTVLKEF
jgi:hypothetical protein